MSGLSGVGDHGFDGEIAEQEQERSQPEAGSSSQADTIPPFPGSTIGNIPTRQDHEQMRALAQELFGASAGTSQESGPSSAASNSGGRVPSLPGRSQSRYAPYSSTRPRFNPAGVPSDISTRPYTVPGSRMPQSTSGRGAVIGNMPRRDQSPQSAPQASTSTSRGSVPRYPPITPDAMAPYEALERLHADIFANTEITKIPENQDMYQGHVEDVGMDELRVINATRNAQSGSGSALGTSGLGPCVAICARGMTADGEVLLGLTHSSSVNDGHTDLALLQGAMQAQGAQHVQFHLVGGLIPTEEDEPGSLPHETDLLDQRKEFDIRGARLHLAQGETDHNDESNSTNVVIDQDGIYYRRNPLYEHSDSE